MLKFRLPFVPAAAQQACPACCTKHTQPARAAGARLAAFSVRAAGPRPPPEARGFGNVCLGLQPLRRLPTTTGQTGQGQDRAGMGTGPTPAGRVPPVTLPQQCGRRMDRGTHASPDVDTGPNERVSSRHTAPAARNPARCLPRSVWACSHPERSPHRGQACVSPGWMLQPGPQQFVGFLQPRFISPLLLLTLHPEPTCSAPQCHHNPLATA